jgi:hypothetical protein
VAKQTATVVPNSSAGSARLPSSDSSRATSASGSAFGAPHASRALHALLAPHALLALHALSASHALWEPQVLRGPQPPWVPTSSGCSMHREPVLRAARWTPYCAHSARTGSTGPDGKVPCLGLFILCSGARGRQVVKRAAPPSSGHTECWPHTTRPLGRNRNKAVGRRPQAPRFSRCNSSCPPRIAGSRPISSSHL